VRLDWAVACRYAEVRSGSATIVGAGFDTFWTEAFPYAIQFFIALRVAAPAEEFGPETDHELRIDLLGPDMAQLDTLKVGFQGGGPGPLHEPGWELTSMIPALVRFTVQAAGTYSLELYLDDEHKKTIPVLVREGGPPS
jgi:hypothetical protein